MNTVSELKNLYTELGGNLTDTYEDIADGAAVGNYSVIPDCIAALAKIAGSTVELPAVSGADNGDILKVIEGKWAKGEETTELPAVTATNNGSILSVIGGAWAKTNYNLVFKDITLNTDANGKFKSSEFTDYPQGLGLGTTCVILGANILNATSLLNGNITEVWAETRQVRESAFTNTNFIIKKIESGQEGVIASQSVTLRVFYLVSNT